MTRDFQSKKDRRAHDALSVLVKGGNATFFTFTTPDVVDYETISARWRAVRHAIIRDMRRRGLKPEYVMNFERHPGYLQKVVNKDTFDEFILRSDGNSHGWHIHGVISCYLDLFRYLNVIRACGFGRVDVRRVKTADVADYLTKHALKAYRGISRRERAKTGVERLRLVNASRGVPSLSCYQSSSPYLELCRYLMRLQLMEVKRSGVLIRDRNLVRVFDEGYSVKCALLLWRKAEHAACLYGTPLYGDSPVSGAVGRGGLRSLCHDLNDTPSRRGEVSNHDRGKSKGCDRLAAPLRASTKIPLKETVP